MAKNYSRSSQNREEPLAPIQAIWISETDQIDDSVVKWAEETGEKLATRRLSSSSIRKFFGEMRRIQSDFDAFKEDVPLLKAKLAYDVGRADKYKRSGIQGFYDVLKPGIEAVERDKKRFERFVKICEAIVAFHKLHYRGND